jgi:hypothetical protein
MPASTDLSDSGSGRDGESGLLRIWHGHLLTLDRRQCVFFCHDATRFAMFLPGLRAPQFAELGRLHRELFLALLEAQGLEHRYIAHAALTLGPLRMDRNTDRSVLASMTRIAGDLQFGLLREVVNVMELDPIQTSLWLNNRPCTIHKQWIWPDKAMREIVETL